jgi:hypothetical protein
MYYKLLRVSSYETVLLQVFRFVNENICVDGDNSGSKDCMELCFALIPGVR